MRVTYCLLVTATVFLFPSLTAFRWTSSLHTQPADYVHISFQSGSPRSRRSLGMPEDVHFRVTVSDQTLDLRLRKSETGRGSTAGWRSGSRRKRGRRNAFERGSTAHRSGGGQGDGTHFGTKPSKSDVEVHKKSSQFPLFVIENGTVSRSALPSLETVAVYENDTMGHLFVIRRNQGHSDFSLEGVMFDVAMNMYYVIPDQHGFHWIRQQDTVKDFRGDYIDNTVSTPGKGNNSSSGQRRHKRHSKVLQLLGMSNSLIRNHLPPSAPTPTRHSPRPAPSPRHVTGRRVPRHVTGRRVRRQAIAHYEIELFMVADYKDYTEWLKFYDNNRTQTDVEMLTYYSFIASWISQRYRSIGNIDPDLRIDIVTTGLLIVKSAADSYWTEGEVHVPGGNGRYVEASQALELFRHWVDVRPDTLPHSDHWMLFTGHDIYTDRNPHIAGLAKLGGLCTYNSVSIIEQDNTASVGATAAHELGHSLSARHDGEVKGCRDEDNYIMSRKLKTPDAEKMASRPWQFSTCSVQAFRRFLSRKKCGLVEQRGSNMVMSTTLQGGQVFSADLQCQLALGKFSFFGRRLQHVDQYQSMCRRLFCAVPWDPSTFQAIFAMEKTTCGHRKWCVQGKCTADVNAPPSLDNCPQGDSPQVQCRRHHCRFYPSHYRDIFCCQTCSQPPPPSNFIYSPANAPVQLETVTRRLPVLPRFRPPPVTATSVSSAPMTASSAPMTASSAPMTASSVSSAPITASSESSAPITASSDSSASSTASSKSSAPTGTTHSSTLALTSSPSPTSTSAVPTSSLPSSSPSLTSISSSFLLSSSSSSSSSSSELPSSSSSSAAAAAAAVPSSSVSPSSSELPLTSSSPSSPTSTLSLPTQSSSSSSSSSSSTPAPPSPTSSAPPPPSTTSSAPPPPSPTSSAPPPPSPTSSAPPPPSPTSSAPPPPSPTSSAPPPPSPTSSAPPPPSPTSSAPPPPSPTSSAPPPPSPTSQGTPRQGRMSTSVTSSTPAPGATSSTPPSESVTQVRVWTSSSPPRTSTANSWSLLLQTSRDTTVPITVTEALTEETLPDVLQVASPQEESSLTATGKTAVNTGTHRPVTATGKPSPAVSTVQQSPAVSTVQQSPAVSTVQQSPAVSTVQQSPAVRTVQQSPVAGTDEHSADTTRGPSHVLHVNKATVTSSAADQHFTVVTPRAVAMDTHTASVTVVTPRAVAMDTHTASVTVVTPRAVAMDTHSASVMVVTPTAVAMDTHSASVTVVTPTAVDMDTYAAPVTENAELTERPVPPPSPSSPPSRGTHTDQMLHTHMTGHLHPPPPPPPPPSRDAQGEFPVNTGTKGHTTLGSVVSVPVTPGVEPVPVTPGVEPVPVTPGVVSVPVTPGVEPVPVTPGVEPVPVTPGVVSVPVTPGVVSVPVTPGVVSVPVTPGVEPVPVTPGVESVPVTPGVESVPADSVTPGVESVPVTPGVESVPVTPGVESVPADSVTPGVESVPVTPGVESVPVTPGVESVPADSVTPGVESVPVTPGVESVPADSVTPGVESVPVTPGVESVPADSVTPGVESVPVTPGVESVPADSVTPGVESVPADSVTPGVESVPVTPGVESVPVTPGVESVPVTPGVESVPVTPGVESVPADSVTPGVESVPVTPGVESVPADSVTPGVESVPVTPGVESVPVTPGVESVPVTPGVESVPVTPGVESVPVTPGVESVPADSVHVTDGTAPPQALRGSGVSWDQPAWRRAAQSARAQYDPLYPLPGQSPSVTATLGAGPVYVLPASRQPLPTRSSPRTVIFSDDFSSARNKALTRYTLLPARSFLDVTRALTTSASTSSGGHESAVSSRAGISDSSRAGISSSSRAAGRCLALCQLFREPALRSGNRFLDGLSRFFRSRLETTFDRLRQSRDRIRHVGDLFRLAPSGDRVTPVARNDYWLPRLLTVHNRMPG
ncbi:uncharacterized protein LOC143291039 [Babylonia areolata]|uniref:uncharacterized protein LOC143291039 n=1 Tax=Babylonia areolata TaxID=304850 RepID=UPI003FCF1C88